MPIIGAQLPKKPKSPFAKRNLLRLQDYSGGMNNKFAAYLLEDNEVSDLQNFHLDEKGTLTQRKGFLKRYGANFATGGIRGMTNYRKEDGTSFLVVGADDKLFYEKSTFQQLFDTYTDWISGTLESVDASVVIGDITLSGTEGAFGEIEFGAPSAIFGGAASSTRDGIWTSPAMDISAVVDKTTGIVIDASTVPAGSTRLIQSRTATTSDMITGVTAWLALGGGGSILSAGNNFLQIRILFSATLVGNPSTQSLLIQFDAAPGVTSLLTGQDTLARYQWGTLNDILYIVNGVNSNRKWTGTGSTAVQGGSPPTVKFVIVHKNRMFGAGSSSNRSRVYFSDLADAESWPALNFLDVGKGDGDVITGMIVYLDAVVIFKNNSIWFLQGDAPSNYVLRRITNEAGCVNVSSLALVKNTVAFLARDGVRFFDGIKTVLSSEKLEGSLNLLNTRRFDLASAIVYKNHYYLAVPEGVSLYNNAVWVFDILRASWTVYRGFNASEWCIWRQYNEDLIFFGNALVGNVHQFEEGYHDDGVAIDAFVVTKQVFGKEQEIVHGLRAGYVTVREVQGLTTSIETRLRPNNTTDSSPITLSLSAGLNVKRFIPSTVGVSTVRTCGVKIRSNTLSRSVAISGIALDWTAKGTRETL